MAEPAYGSLAFAEQIQFFLQKLNLPTATWRDIWQSAHDRAFVVAGAMKADLIDDLRMAVQKGIDQGTTLEEFRRDFEVIVAHHGWTGWTGEGTAGGRAWRTRVIYETNLRTSYAAGRWAQLKAAGFPYLRYKHNDNVLNPRPHHLALDGRIFRADDPFWSRAAVPNGFGCKCWLEGVSEREMRRLGKTGPDTPPEGWEPDEGWDYAPGASVADDINRLVAAKRATLSAQLAKDLAEAVASPPVPPQIPATKMIDPSLDISANGAIIGSNRGGISQASTAGANPMTATAIYQDERRTLTVAADGASLTASNQKGVIGSVGLDTAKILPLDKKTAAAVKASGQDPEGWYFLRSGTTSMALPPATRQPVEQAVAARAAAKVAAKAAADDAAKAYAATLEGQREALVRAEYNTYRPDAFPGSAQWLKNQKAAQALKEFDEAHPEIVAKIEAEKKAAEKARYDALSDFVKRGS